MIDLTKITERQKLIIAKGLLDYQYIMDNWRVNDEDFKAVYYDFYLKARWATMNNQNNINAYFSLLQHIFPEDNLMDVLFALENQIEPHSHEFSLVSKLIHTRNPNSPIYDKKVRDYLRQQEGVGFWWKIPNRESGAKRGTTEEDKIRHDWEFLCKWYDGLLGSKRGKDWIDWFDDRFPAHKCISKIKKIDFIIFATN